MKHHNLHLQQALLAWFSKHGRHDLPWQHPKTPYRVWLSEVMLQQTQVNTVIGYFQRLIEQFPTVQSLAEADLDEVLKLWAGLGYYRRAHYLHQAARKIIDDFSGNFPDILSDLMTLPGVGRSTAGAILAMGHHRFGVICDGNVKRVLARLLAIDEPKDSTQFNQKVWFYAEQWTPLEAAGNYAQAIMDLGATVCKRTRPHCETCPWQTNCRAYQQQTAHLYPRPAKARSKDKPIYHLNCHLFYFKSKKEIILSQQTNQSIWPKLWCFPHVMTPYQQASPSQTPAPVTCCHRMTHELTHRHLIIDVHIVVIDDDSPLPPLPSHHRHVAIGDLGNYAMPTPFRRFLDRLIRQGYDDLAMEA